MAMAHLQCNMNHSTDQAAVLSVEECMWAPLPARTPTPAYHGSKSGPARASWAHGKGAASPPLIGTGIPHPEVLRRMMQHNSRQLMAVFRSIRLRVLTPKLGNFEPLLKEEQPVPTVLEMRSPCWDFGNPNRSQCHRRPTSGHPTDT